MLKRKAKFIFGLSPLYPVEDKIIQEEKFYPWQTELADMLRHKPDKRSIIWIYENQGGVGKSSFTDWIIYHLGAIILEGKNNDVLFCAQQHASSLYVYDVPRSNLNHVSYAALEKVKNGTYMSSKYESAPVLRCNPHLIVFANEPPEKYKLSPRQVENRRNY